MCVSVFAPDLPLPRSFSYAQPLWPAHSHQHQTPTQLSSLLSDSAHGIQQPDIRRERELQHATHTRSSHSNTYTHTHIPGPANGITAAGNSGPRRGHHLSGMEEEEEEMVMVAVHEEEEEKCLFKANAMIELDADCNHATHERVRRKFIQS